jgi:membrane protease YdiL (CAAX protease family)
VFGAFGAFLGAQILAVLWIGPAAFLAYGDEPLPPVAERPIWLLPLFGIGLWLGYLGLPVLVKMITQSGPMVDFSPRLTIAQAALAVALGVGAQLVMLPVLYWFVLRLISGDPSETAQALGDRVNNVGDGILFSVSVIVVAAFVEEWFYRGMLLPTLTRRFGLVAGVIGSSALFAAVHGEVILLPGLFCFAVILAVLTARSGRIGPA